MVKLLRNISIQMEQMRVSKQATELTLYATFLSSSLSNYTLSSFPSWFPYYFKTYIERVLATLCINSN